MHHSKNSKLKGNLTKFGKVRKVEVYNKVGKIEGEFDLIFEASSFTNVSESAIRNNLCGISKSTRKYTFKYKEI